MKNTLTIADVHRFRDSVGVHVRGIRPDETVYLTSEQARQIAAELVRFADSCDSVPFSECPLRSWQITAP